VGAAQGRREGVGSVLGGRTGEREQALHHALHLELRGRPLPDHGELYLPSGQLIHREASQPGGGNRDPTRLSEHQGGAGVDGDEDLLHHHGVRPMLFDHFAHTFVNRRQPDRQRRPPRRPHGAVRDVTHLGTTTFDDAVPRHDRARIDAENAHTRLEAEARRGARQL
jgi:hypothetical protein